VNRCSTAKALSRPEQHVVWFAGLRGAVAFMCALRFPENKDAQYVTEKVVEYATPEHMETRHVTEKVTEFILHEQAYHSLTVVDKYSTEVQEFGPNKKPLTVIWKLYN